MFEEVIIKGLASELASYKSKDLNVYFEGVKYDYPGISSANLSRLVKLNAFNRQLELKELVGDSMQNSYTKWELNKWIVHQWGGIPRFDISNHDRITKFRDHLQKGAITAREFDRISSLSKIASFVSRDSFFIYDSRVAFSLDGLLLKMKQNRPQLPIKFFPIPSARNARDRRMKTLIIQSDPNAVFLSKEEAYIEYNKLILCLSKEKELKKDLPPRWIEMLLFALGKTNGIIETMMISYK